MTFAILFLIALLADPLILLPSLLPRRRA